MTDEIEMNALLGPMKTKTKTKNETREDDDDETGVVVVAAAAAEPGNNNNNNNNNNTGRRHRPQKPSTSRRDRKQRRDDGGGRRGGGGLFATKRSVVVFIVVALTGTVMIAVAFVVLFGSSEEEANANANANNAVNNAICADDPEFRFEGVSDRTCAWIADRSNDDICDEPHELHSTVRDACPVACGVCEPETEAETAAAVVDVDATTTTTMTTTTTLVEGVPDGEVYCEDLSRYEKWHEIRISKDDGVMYEVVRRSDHDGTSFTQGLTYARGKLYESAGLYGESSVRVLDREDPSSLEVRRPMAPDLFAEGIAYCRDELVQITWKARKGFVYDPTDLSLKEEFSYTTTMNQGWGITWDRCNDELVVTDGSANLHFWDPTTKKELRRVEVIRRNGSKAIRMNEIEFWRGRVLANVWYEDVILVIDPETGVVEKEYEFSQLWPKTERKENGADVLNGISVSKDPDVLYFTGKRWDRMYEIKLLPEL